MLSYKSILIILSLILVIYNVKSLQEPSNIKLIKLKANFVALRGEIDEDSASNFISDIMKIKGDKIYIYLVTPGGSITSGNTIIQVIESLTRSGKNIICIADHAYSMGFVIFQSCPVRYIMSHSIIMQHQASLNVKGPIKQARNLFGLVEKIVEKSNVMQAERLELTTEQFNDLTAHDFWLYGDEIINAKAADEIVNVVCDMDTNIRYNVTKRTIFGNIKLIFSICPLIHMPLDIIINMDKNKITNQVIDEYENFKKII